MDVISIKMNQPLSSVQLEKSLGISMDDIMKYSQLRDYTTIESLLPADGDYKILLLEEKPSVGHYVAIMRQNGKYYYFNSYGSKFDTDLYLINRVMRSILGQSRKEITRLLGDTKIKWNTFKYQGPTSSTCGRWCVLAITMICKMGFDLDEFNEWVKKTKLKDESYDRFVTRMTAKV
jgi:hypothetical protein